MARPTGDILAAARNVAALAPERAQERQAIEELAEMVVEVTGTPIDERGVAATLESRGLRDVDAVERYGRRDIFELAEDVYVRAREVRPGRPTWASADEHHVPARSFAWAYLRGSFSFLPLLVQVLLLVTLGYSQWGWVHFDLRQASTVAVGVGLALIGTAGSIQVAGYLGPLFAEAGKHTLARTATYRMLAVGVLSSAVLAGIASAVILATGAYSTQRLGQTLVYDALISVVWLLNGLLYMVKRQWGILIGIAGSVGIVALVLHVSDWGIYAAHWLGLGGAAVIQLALVAQVLRRRAQRTSPDLRRARFPRSAVLGRATVPLFIYGTAYFVLLICDRGIAWSAGRHPLPIWFNTSYELGLDVAMFAAALGLAFLEVALHAFNKVALPRQDRYAGLAARAHNRWYGRFFARQIASVITLMLLGGAITIGVLVALHSGGSLGKVARYYDDPVTRRVFVLGFAGYGLLALGIAGAGVLFSLDRARAAARAVLAGAIVDVVVGVVLSRRLGFSYAAVGLAAGAFVFAAVAAFEAARALRRADYALYAAY